MHAHRINTNSNLYKKCPQILCEQQQNFHASTVVYAFFFLRISLSFESMLHENIDANQKAYGRVENSIG